LIIQPQIIKEFLTEKEIQALNYWTEDAFVYNKEIFADANMGIAGTRYTTRYIKDCSKINFPQVAFDVRERIAERLNITNSKIPNYCHGIVTGIGFDQGDIFNHLDPIYHKGTYTLHCNVITQQSETGGVTVINGTPYPTNPRDVLVYPVSEVRHSVTRIEGSTPRILWVFGYCIDR